ncbi:MAG: TolC family protein [Dysgonamonadaceae bacterium]|jgi:outer membrane protein TolC|nr:TolC family protein [Dysgonamonadaceae bacterium]
MRRTIILLLIILSQKGFAQEKVWTLDDCIQYALQHHPKSIRQEAQNRIYRQNQLEARGGWLPSLSAESSLSMNFGRGIDPETNTYVSTNALSNSYQIYSSMTLFDGLAQLYRVKTANIHRLMGKEELRDMQDKLSFEVMEIFFNMLYYKGTVELAQQQLDESSNNLTKFQRMEELGMKSLPDLNEVQAKEAEDRFALTKQTNLYSLEIIRLKAAMNLPPDEDLTVAGYDSAPVIRPEIENALAIYRQALSALPQVKTAGQSLKASEMEYKIAKARLFPTLSLSAGFSTGFSRLMDDKPYVSFQEQLKMREGSYVGLSLSVPIFSRFSRSSEVKRSQQQLIIAQSQHEEILRQVYSDIEQTVADVNGLADEYVHARKRTVAMQSAHQTNLRKYEEGLIDAIDLSTSANRLLNARVEEIHTHLKYQLKYKLLQYYKGEQSWTSF